MPSAVDTNVLVRFLVDDGSDHAALARRVFAEEPVFVPTSVVMETEWVLRSKFGYSPTLICDAFDRLLGFEAVLVQDADLVVDAVDALRVGLDFADALHLLAASDCDRLYTFDSDFIRRSDRMTGSVPVMRPGSSKATS